MSWQAAKSVTNQLLVRADRSPNEEAYVFLDDDGGREGVTCGELVERSAAISDALVGEVDRSVPVLLMCAPGVSFVSGLVGCMLRGAIAVPCYPPDPVRAERMLARLESIKIDTGASLVLTDRELAPYFAGLFSDVPGLRGLRVLAVEDLEEAGSRQSAGRAGAAGVALLQYTSGTTRTPRGVVISHANLMSNLAMIHEGVAVPAGATSVLWLPPYHDMGLVTTLYALTAGHRCVSLSPLSFIQRPSRWLQAVSDNRAYFSGGPNFGYDLCVRRVPVEAVDHLDLSEWTVAFTGAEKISAATIRNFSAKFAPARFSSTSMYPAYGLAEFTVAGTGGERGAKIRVQKLDRNALSRGEVVLSMDDVGAAEVVGCGRPRGDHAFRIVDAARGIALPPRQIGEIWLDGPSKAERYWSDAEGSPHVFGAHLVDDPTRRWLRTGDLGYEDDGDLFVTGRADDVIVIRGQNFYPEDLEWEVEKVAGIRKGSVVIFQLGAEVESELVAVCETGFSPDEAPSLAPKIRSAIRDVSGLLVDRIVVLAPGSVPKTSSGKRQRRECRRALLGGELLPIVVWRAAEEKSEGRRSRVADVAATSIESDAVCQWIIGYLSGRLGVVASTSSNFIELDIDSLALVEMSAQLAEMLGTVLPPTVAFDNPTVGQLAVACSLVASDAVKGAPPEPNDSLEVVVRDVAGLSDEELMSELRQKRG